MIVERPDGERLSSSGLYAISGFSGSGTRYRRRSGAVTWWRRKMPPAEAGELLGIPRQFVDRLIDTGKLPGRRLPGSRHRRLRVADVLDFGESRDKRLTHIADAVNTLVDGGAEY